MSERDLSWQSARSASDDGSEATGVVRSAKGAMMNNLVIGKTGKRVELGDRNLFSGRGGRE